METEKTKAAELSAPMLHRNDKIEMIKQLIDLADDVIIDIVLTILK